MIFLTFFSAGAATSLLVVARASSCELSATESSETMSGRVSTSAIAVVDMRAVNLLAEVERCQDRVVGVDDECLGNGWHLEGDCLAGLKIGGPTAARGQAVKQQSEDK